MTTQITITNDGPENLLVRYYNKERQFKDAQHILTPGDSIPVTVWDDNIPVTWCIGKTNVIPKPTGEPLRFFRAPPATY